MTKKRSTRVRGVTSLGGGKYALRVYIRDPKTGKEREAVRTITASSVQEAAARRTTLRAEMIAARTPLRAQRVTLTAYAESWAARKRAELKPSTRATYGNALDIHILPHFGDHFVDAIEPEEIVAWRDRMRADGAARESCNGRLRVLKTLLRDAVGDLRLQFDPTLRVKALPASAEEFDAETGEGDEDEGRGFEADELRRLLVVVERQSPQWWPLVATLAWTGLRFGEATALRWTDLDDVDEVIHVRRAQWRGHVGHPKARASRRTVPLVPELADVLRDHRRNLIATEHPGVASGYLFTSARRRSGSKNPVGFHHTGVLTKPITKAMKAAKIEPDGRTLTAAHSFRHTFNNLVRQVTCETVRQAMIGHADEASGKRYSSVSVDEMKQASAKVISLVRGSSR